MPVLGTATIKDAFDSIAEFGVRVFADLLGDVAEATPDLLALELAASSRAPYCHLARFVQIIAKKE